MSETTSKEAKVLDDLIALGHRNAPLEDELAVIQCAIDAAVAQERERCAKVAETKYAPTEWGRYDIAYANAGVGIAAAIRKEG